MNQQANVPANDKSHRISSVWLMYVLIGFFAVVMLCSKGYILNTGSRMAAKHTPLMYAATEIKNAITLAHLWFEEMISGDRTVNIDQIRKLQDSAAWHAQAMLDGGKRGEEVVIPLDKDKLRNRIKVIQAKLSEFRDITRQRYELPEDSVIGSKIDQRHDAVFGELMTEADHVKIELQRSIRADLGKFRIVQIVLIVLCAAAIALLGVSFDGFFRRRMKHEQQLRAANQKLKASDGQLRQQSEFLRSMIDSLAHPFYVIDADDYTMKLANSIAVGSADW